MGPPFPVAYYPDSAAEAQRGEPLEAAKRVPMRTSGRGVSPDTEPGAKVDCGTHAFSEIKLIGPP